MSIIATIIGAGLAAAGSVASALSANSQRKLQHQDQLDLMKVQQGYNEANMQTQLQNQMALNEQSLALTQKNQRQSASNYVQGLKAAGLNPNFQNGTNSVQISGGSSSSLSGGAPTAPLQESPVSNMLSGLQIGQNLIKTMSEAKKTESETTAQDIENMNKPQYYESLINNIDNQTSLYKSQSCQLEAEIKKVDAQISELESQKNLNETQQSQLEQLKQIQSEAHQKEQLIRDETKNQLKQLANYYVAQSNAARSNAVSQRIHALAQKAISNKTCAMYEFESQESQKRIEHYTQLIATAKSEAEIKAIEADAEKNLGSGYRLFRMIKNDVLDILGGVGDAAGRVWQPSKTVKRHVTIKTK